MSRTEIVMKALKVEKQDALKIIEHLEICDCLHWVDDYDTENNNDEPLVDVHYESTFEDMIDWQYEDCKPSQILGMSENIKDHKEMLQLSNKVIFWYGLV